MSLIAKGKVWKFGDHINTDYMAPSFSRDLPWPIHGMKREGSHEKA